MWNIHQDLINRIQHDKITSYDKLTCFQCKHLDYDIEEYCDDGGIIGEIWCSLQGYDVELVDYNICQDFMGVIE